MSRRPSVRSISTVALAVAVMTVAACTGGGDDASDETTTTPSRTTAKPVSTFTGTYLAVVAEDTEAGKVSEVLVVVDPETYEVVGRLPLGEDVESADAATNARIRVVDGVAWVTRADDDSTAVYRIAPGATTATPTAEIAFSDAGLAVGVGAAWVSAGDKVVILDPATGAIKGEITSATLGANVVAVDVAVAGANVWVSSDAGALLRIDPISLAVTPEPPVVVRCHETPTTREQFAANAADTILDLETVGTTLVAATSSGCTPDPGLALIDPVTGTRRTLSLPAAPFQTLAVLAAGAGAAVARADSNDLIPVDVATATVGVPVVLPTDTLAETCTGTTAVVVCTGGLDDAVAAEADTVPLKFERHAVVGVRGTVLAWGIGA